jgi:hypothetical protein
MDASQSGASSSVAAEGAGAGSAAGDPGAQLGEFLSVERLEERAK